jgi:hypothetical protein
VDHGHARWLAGATAVALSACSSPAPTTEGPRAIRVEGTELVVTTATGQVRSEALVGQTLTVGTHDVRLTSIELDDGVTLHHFVLADGAEICAPDASGQRWAIPWTDEHGAVQLTCTSGAIGKCIRFGYPPSRAALHQACIRMVRADYGGDGATATRDGTRIEFCDRDGIHPCTGNDDAVEAAWTATGAWCVAYPRIPELTSLATLGEHYPRLVLGAPCTRTAARREPTVLLFERSR